MSKPSITAPLVPADKNEDMFSDLLTAAMLAHDIFLDDVWLDGDGEEEEGEEGYELGRSLALVKKKDVEEDTRKQRK